MDRGMSTGMAVFLVVAWWVFALASSGCGRDSDSGSPTTPSRVMGGMSGPILHPTIGPYYPCKAGRVCLH